MKWVLAVAVVLVVQVGDARGHGGEDHGSAASSGATSADAGGRRSAYGQTDSFELLLKFAPPEAGKQAGFDVFLSDYASNRPVRDARIELEFAGAQPVRTVAEATGRPGIYHALAELSAGQYPVIATVTAGEVVDLVEIKSLDFTVAPAAATGGPPHSHFPWRVVGGIGAAALLLGLLVLVLWRRRRRAASVAVMMLLASIPIAARGHGGEDHDAPSSAPRMPATVAAGAIYLAKESQFLLEVETAVAGEREVEARIETVGRVIPRSDGHAAILAPQPGRIVAVGGRVPFIGDRVTAGQPLVVIAQSLGAAETSSMRAEAVRARANLEQARARRDQAVRNLERQRSLAGVVPGKEIQQAELEVMLAERDIERAQRETALFSGAASQRLTVTAPITGVIAEAEVSLGEQVSADTKLFTIIEPSTLWVEADVFESDLGKIEQLGSAFVRVQGYPESFVAKLYRLGQLVDPSTRTAKAIFAVDNVAGKLRPGMFAEISIAAGGKASMLTIPDAALVEEGSRRFVFVHLSPEEFARREVALGGRDGDFWAVQGGLDKGERVVSKGTYQLRTAR